ncbi:DUF7563 family protein [Halorussus sp. AFM4]
MPTRQNFESFVTQQYVREFTPIEVDQPRACPNCEDKTRSGSDVREKRT